MVNTRQTRKLSTRAKHSLTPEALKRIREGELKMTQGQLAEALGVPREAINRWESGSRPIPLIAEKLLAFIRLSGSLRS